MKPINSINFGNLADKIAVKFHNGTGVVSGYIVKQLGAKKFLVGGFAGAGGDSAGAAVTRTCLLVQTTAALVDGECTIEITNFVGGGTERVKSISSFKAHTVQGNTLAFKRAVAASAVGQGTITVLSAPLTNATDA